MLLLRETPYALPRNPKGEVRIHRHARGNDKAPYRNLPEVQENKGQRRGLGVLK